MLNIAVKKVILVLLIVSSPFLLFAQDFQVDRGEVSATSDSSVKFINYVGPYRRIDSIAAIRGIGTFLGTPQERPVSYAGKYRVVRAVSEGTGLDADVFIIDPLAEVDHIINLRLMIEGYLTAAFGYTPADAKVLAVFITTYNAVYRKNIVFFTGKYKPEVLKYLTAENAGLSLSYADWPGKTRIVIPLGQKGAAAGAGSLAATALADQQVVDELRKQEDKGIPDRQAMVDIQERAIADEQAAIDRDRAALEEARQRAGQESAAAATPASQTGAAETTPTATTPTTPTATTPTTPTDTAATGSGTTPGSTSSTEALDRQQAELDQRQAAVDQAQVQVDTQRDQIATDIRSDIGTETPVTPDTTATQPAATPGTEPSETPAVTPSTTTASSTTAIPSGVTMLKIDEISGVAYGTLITTDPATGKVSRKSQVNSIRGRRYIELGGKIIAVAGKTEGGGAVRLMAFSPATFEASITGTDDIFGESFLVGNGNNVYAIVVDGGQFYLGKFDTSLKLISRSTRAVERMTSISITGSYAVVQLSTGAIGYISTDDMKLFKELR